MTQILHAITGGNILARKHALWTLTLAEFYATLHAVLLYDRGLSVAFPRTLEAASSTVRDSIRSVIESAKSP